MTGSWFTLWAAALRGKTGWRRYSNAWFFGALAAMSFPPFNVTPMLWVSFPALVFLLQGAPHWRKAFGVGWCFAFGVLTVGLYWIAGSMLVDFKHFWWAIPLAVAGLPAAFALYYAVAAAAAWRWGLARLDGVLFLGLAWFAADYARGHAFTGFPWNIMGYGWAGFLPVLQITSMVGIYGLTLLTILCAMLPAMLAEGRNKRLVLASVALLAGIAGWGEWRLQHASGAMVPDVRLRLVGPSVAQANKWKTAEREPHLASLMENSFAPAAKPVTHIIWPETATSFYLSADPAHRQAIAAALKPGMSVITGDVTVGDVVRGKPRYYNSLIAIDDKARITAGYDKSHLVPFGEYMPWREYIPLPALIGNDFSAGEGPKTLRVAGLPPFSPLICYEIIFPGTVTDDSDRPKMLVNVSNDAWYEGTTGPWQHFAIARVRAIEEGIPLVRAANKSVSGVVDAYGRTIASIGWDQPRFVDSDLPAPLAFETVYVQWRDKPLWAAIVILFVIAIGLRLKRSENHV